MTLSDIASLGSLASGVAVLISLIYLSLQVKQSERHQHAAIRQGRATRTIEINLAATEPSVADAMPKGATGADDTTRTQFMQFNSVWSAYFRNGEDTYFQHEEKLVSEKYFASFIAGWRNGLTLPGVRALWMVQRVGFERGFVEFMDKIMAEVPASSRGDLFALWKSALAAERASATQ